jgi:Mrp family chromosome partitioning ATPase
MPETAGLSDGLAAEEERKLPLVQVSSLLTLLPAGRPTPDPMASLSSKRMRHIVGEAREAFDWVILDTPPIAVLTDASLLAAMVDTAVLVIRAARTPLAAAQRALETLGRGRVLGVVLNAVEKQTHGGYFYHYYSSYYGTE